MNIERGPQQESTVEQDRVDNEERYGSRVELSDEDIAEREDAVRKEQEAIRADIEELRTQLREKKDDGASEEEIEALRQTIASQEAQLEFSESFLDGVRSGRVVYVEGGTPDSNTGE